MHHDAVNSIFSCILKIQYAAENNILKGAECCSKSMLEDGPCCSKQHLKIQHAAVNSILKISMRAAVNSILEDAGCYRILKNILKIQHTAVNNILEDVVCCHALSSILEDAVCCHALNSILEDTACYSKKHLSNQWELWIVLQVVQYATDREEWFCILYIAKNLMTLTFLGTHSVKQWKFRKSSRNTYFHSDTVIKRYKK